MAAWGAKGVEGFPLPDHPVAVRGPFPENSAKMATETRALFQGTTRFGRF